MHQLKSSSGRRVPGRRPTGSAELNRDVILAKGLALSRQVPLQDISMVRLAREFGVTAASIHNYLEGRSSLTSGIVELFLSEMLRGWPKPSRSWQSDLSAVATAIYRHFVRYPGIAAYFVAQNRFRVLIPAVAQDGGEPLLRFLDQYFAAINRAGLDPQRSAVYALVLMQFIHISAHATASHQWPSEQRLLRSNLSRLGRERYPAINRLRDSYLRVEGESAFKAGVALILSGLEVERRAIRKTARQVP
jgi:AcrR family transcriptional regulator